PAQFEAVLVDEAEFLAGARAGRTRKAGELGRIAGREEAGIARFEAELRADRLGAFLANIPGDGAGAFQLAALLAPADVAEARLALALRPAVHAVAEGARAAGVRRNGPDLGLGVGGENAGEHLEARTAEMLRDV